MTNVSPLVQLSSDCNSCPRDVTFVNKGRFGSVAPASFKMSYSVNGCSRTRRTEGPFRILYLCCSSSTSVRGLSWKSKTVTQVSQDATSHLGEKGDSLQMVQNLIKALGLDRIIFPANLARNTARFFDRIGWHNTEKYANLVGSIDFFSHGKSFWTEDSCGSDSFLSDSSPLVSNVSNAR